jgi:hypothetical protein
MPLDNQSPADEIAAFAVDYVRREFDSLRDGFARDGVTMLDVHAEPVADRESWDLVIVLRRDGADGNRQLRFDLDRHHGSAADPGEIARDVMQWMGEWSPVRFEALRRAP